MKNKPQPKTPRPCRKIKYPHLRKVAAEMGYNFSYLYRVLEGRDPHFKDRKGLKEKFWNISSRITLEQKGRRHAVASQTIICTSVNGVAVVGNNNRINI